MLRAPAIPTNRDGGRIDPTQGHTGRGVPPQVHTISEASGCSHDPSAVDRMIIVRVDEGLPPKPLSGQSFFNYHILVVLTNPPAPSTEAKYENEDNRGCGESHNHKDASHSPFVLEKSLRDIWHSQG